MNLIRRLRINHALPVSLLFSFGWVYSSFTDVKLDFFIIGFSTLVFNIFVFIYNDYVDAPYDVKDKEKRKRNVFSNKKNMEIGKIILLGLFLLSIIPLFFVSWEYIILVLIMYFLGIFYSAPFFRAKARPFFDLIFHGSWGAIVFFTGYYYFFGLELSTIIATILIFAGSVAAGLTQEIRDYMVDKKTRQKTSVQLLGLKSSTTLRNSIYYSLSILACFVFILTNKNLFLLITISIIALKTINLVGYSSLKARITLGIPSFLLIFLL
ncbi:MAG: UbiA family prenyltransferase [Candidatus Hodarchaeales archaeon]|jgi:4-hydroxybenzoate polyprenyltransferase